MLLRRLWTAEEEERLREWATKISVSRIAVRLKRSPSAVKSRALELGLSLSMRDKPEQDRPSPVSSKKEPRADVAGQGH